VRKFGSAPTDDRPTRGRAAWAWVALASLLALGALVCAPFAPGLLNRQPGRAATEPWRWWSAAWVHLSPMHLGTNLAGAALVAALGWVACCEPGDALAWFMAWPLTHLGLLAQPALTHYAGLSGVLHAGVMIAALALVLRERGLRRVVGAVLLVGAVVKVVLEQPWLGPSRAVPGWDFAVAPVAHASGVLAGALCTGAITGWRRRKAQSSA
jgi:rhomboid family GlyGly-CTERM serine protease